jgi:hypothetical protein
VTKPRDYKHEYNSYHASPEQKKNRAQRNAARRDMEAAGRVKKGDGKDVDHKNPIRSGGGNSKGNLAVTSQGKNRAWRKGKS